MGWWWVDLVVVFLIVFYVVWEVFEVIKDVWLVDLEEVDVIVDV